MIYEEEFEENRRDSENTQDEPDQPIRKIKVLAPKILRPKGNISNKIKKRVFLTARKIIRCNRV